MSNPLVDAAAFAELQAHAGADFVAELVQTFAEEAPQILAELEAAFAAGAADRFTRAANSLKSHSATFGATRLAQMGRSLELAGLPADALPVQALERQLERTIAALRKAARG